MKGIETIYLNTYSRIIPKKEGLSIEFGTVDIAKNSTKTFSITLPYFCKFISLLDIEDTKKNSDVLLGLLKSISEKSYPTLAQAHIYQQIEENNYTAIKLALQEFCKRNTCLCPLFYSVGCYVCFHNGGSLKNTKIVQSLVRVLSPHFVSYVIEEALSSIEGKDKYLPFLERYPRQSE